MTTEYFFIYHSLGCWGRILLGLWLECLNCLFLDKRKGFFFLLSRNRLLHITFCEESMLTKPPCHNKTWGFATEWNIQFGVNIFQNVLRKLQCPPLTMLMTRWLVQLTHTGSHSRLHLSIPPLIQCIHTHPCLRARCCCSGPLLTVKRTIATRRNSSRKHYTDTHISWAVSHQKRHRKWPQICHWRQINALICQTICLVHILL